MLPIIKHIDSVSSPLSYPLIIQPGWLTPLMIFGLNVVVFPCRFVQQGRQNTSQLPQAIHRVVSFPTPSRPARRSNQEMEAEKEDSEDEEMEDDGADVPRLSAVSWELGEGEDEHGSCKNCTNSRIVLLECFYFHVSCVIIYIYIGIYLYIYT